MIARLCGLLIEKKPPVLIIDVNGVAYEVEAPMTTFYQLPDINNKINLHTHFVVRQDAQLLYGFYSQEERTLFRALIKVNGVGPKLALTILSSIEPDEFVRCVHDTDTAALVRLPGIGKKTAERLIIEMRDKVSDWQSNANQNTATSASPFIKKSSASQDAIAALIALGYKPQDASRAVNHLSDKTASSEELIRLALREVSA